MAPKEHRLTRSKAAEQVKRDFRQAARFCRLEAHSVWMRLMPDKRAWVVHGGAKPQGWPHQVAPVSFQVLVWVATGKVDPVCLFCDITEGDPVLATVGGVLKLSNCDCEVADLPRVLQEVWLEREQILTLQKSRQKFRNYTGRFTWKWFEGF
jgi:hypothetical protein